MTRDTKILGTLCIAVLVTFLVTISIVFIPEIWHFIFETINLPLMTFIVTFVALIIAGAEYYRKKRIDKLESRPYVVASLSPKETSQNIFELVIQNTGKTLARDISIKLSPDHKQHENASKSMNELGVLKNMGIMTPKSSRRFYFGAYVNTSDVASIKKRFQITVKYADATGKNIYEDIFTCDPTDYEGMLQNNEKGIRDIHKTLDEILKSHKELVGQQKKIAETFVEHGIRVRNLHTSNLSSNDLLRLTTNLFTNSSENEGWLRPYVYDHILLVKQARDLLLKEPQLSNEREALIGELNKILSDDWHYDEEKVEAHFKKLNELIVPKDQRETR